MQARVEMQESEAEHAHELQERAQEEMLDAEEPIERAQMDDMFYHHYYLSWLVMLVFVSGTPRIWLRHILRCKKCSLDWVVKFGPQLKLYSATWISPSMSFFGRKHSEESSKPNKERGMNGTQRKCAKSLSFDRWYLDRMHKRL